MTRFRKPHEREEELLAHREQFLRFVTSRLGDREAALDVVQDSFVRALTNADQLRDEDKLISWFYGILRRTLIDLHRRKASEANLLERLAYEPRSEEEERETLCACLSFVIGQLSADDRSLLQALELEQISPAAYAEKIGVTPGALKVRRHRARRRLKDRLARLCGCLFDRDAGCFCPVTP